MMKLRITPTTIFWPPGLSPQARMHQNSSTLLGKNVEWQEYGKWVGIVILHVEKFSWMI